MGRAGGSTNAARPILTGGTRLKKGILAESSSTGSMEGTGETRTTAGNPASSVCSGRTSPFTKGLYLYNLWCPECQYASPCTEWLKTHMALWRSRHLKPIIQVCNKTQSVIVNVIIGYDRYRAQSTHEDEENQFSGQTSAVIFFENVNRNTVHLLNGCQTGSEAQGGHSSQRMEGHVPDLPIGWTIDETMLAVYF